MNYVTGPFEKQPIEAALKISEHKVAKAHAEALATARAEKKIVVAAKQQKGEAAKKAQEDADRAFAEELSRQEVAKAKAALDAEAAHFQAEKKEADASPLLPRPKGFSFCSLAWMLSQKR